MKTSHQLNYMLYSCFVYFMEINLTIVYYICFCSLYFLLAVNFKINSCNHVLII